MVDGRSKGSGVSVFMAAVARRRLQQAVRLDNDCLCELRLSRHCPSLKTHAWCIIRANAGIVWVRYPGDYATFIFHQLRYGTRARTARQSLTRRSGWGSRICVTKPAASAAAFAQQTRYHDNRGNSLGTSSTSSGGQTRYYDSRGSSLGTSSTNSSGTTTFYDSRSNVTGRASRR